MSTYNYSICEKIIAALDANELLRDYSNLKFSKVPKLSLGIDENKPPLSSDAPYIMVIPDGCGFQDDNAGTNNIFVGCVITDSTASTVGNVTKIQGFQTIEAFERLVYDCIDDLFKEYISEYSIMEQGEAKYLSRYPEFHSQRSLKIISQRS